MYTNPRVCCYPHKAPQHSFQISALPYLVLSSSEPARVPEVSREPLPTLSPVALRLRLSTRYPLWHRYFCACLCFVTGS